MKLFLSLGLTLLLVAAAMVTFPITAKADVPFMTFGCPVGYYANNVGQCYPLSDGLLFSVPGSGGDGWPQQCDGNAMVWYGIMMDIWGYVDPDYFYSTFGCYPY